MSEALAPWRALIDETARRHGLDPRVVGAIILVESQGKASAVNPRSKATGLMQVMPREAGPVFADRPTQRELLDPATNIEWGCRILAHNLGRSGGDLYRAVYNYSGGPAWNPQGGFAAFEQRYWSKIQRYAAELGPVMEPLPHRDELQEQARAARWHTEQATRELEGAQTEAARARLLSEVIPRLYDLERGI